MRSIIVAIKNPIQLFVFVEPKKERGQLTGLLRLKDSISLPFEQLRFR